MSSDQEVPSVKERNSYFCKVCQVACLNSYGLCSHYKDKQHEKMEEAYYGQKHGKHLYSHLQDYISCPIRKEPLIGLQYIVQLYPEVHCQDSFKCTLCKVIGPLHFIIKHIESLKHRRNYMSVSHKHLFPLYAKWKSFYEKNQIVREHAKKVEQQERTLAVNDSKSCTSRIGVKNDFWKYSLKRQEKLDELNEKLAAYETQKKNILQYMETFVITSSEEAEVVQNLTEELEAAVNVFDFNMKPRHDKYSKHKSEKRTEDGERKYSRPSDYYVSKKRSIWYEKDLKPSRSPVCKDQEKPISDKHSEEYRPRKKSRSASKDMLLTVTFSTGSEIEENNAIPKEEQQEPQSACSVNEQFVMPSDNLSETTLAMCYYPETPINRGLFQVIRGKSIRKPSKDVAKWESLFASNRPETRHSMSAWGPKSPLLNETDESPLEEKKENPRRASLDALSTFTLFSREGQHGPASSQPSSDTFSTLQGPVFKSYKGNVFKFKGPQHEPKLSGDNDEELPCSSSTICNEAGTTDNVEMHVKTEQYDNECQLKAGTSCDQLSDVNAIVDQEPKSSNVVDSSSEYTGFKACGSRHLDKADSQDADSNVLSSTLTSGRLHAAGRQLSPEVLQLFKGKDTDRIVLILKSLSPFYPALQELDLEVFAKGLSKTGAITE